MKTPVKLLLDAKREGRELDPADIASLIADYTRGDVPDYQMAAFAMAVCCRGLSPAETAALTEAMRVSGACLAWGPGLPTADKHSTGGVGDKLSLVIQPLAASCGLRVPSLVGRGLGLTGGTVDKLESIPGYDAGLSLDAFRRVVDACGCALAAQTAEIAPADRKLYALRDVTGTVPAIPLIVASILSKKLAEGAETLVFDVKCGTGAFMREREQALALAQALVDGARTAGRRAAALVTEMDAPLGASVGNALEIREALQILGLAEGGASPLSRDVVELSLEFAAMMVSRARGMDLAAARAACRTNLANGAAGRVFAEMVHLQGGDLAVFRRNCDGFYAQGGVACTAPADGYVAAIDARAVAEAAFALGAGRGKTTDAIDPAAGVEFLVQRGDSVARGQPLARVHARREAAKLPAVAAGLKSAFRFAPSPLPHLPRILATLGS